MSGARISGVGEALPSAELTNEMLGARLGVTSEWIEERTGIRARRIAAASETTTRLATIAARQALLDAKKSSGDIDLVICATSTAEMRFPSTACRIEGLLECGAAAYDISAACSGFLFALAQADAAIRTGMSRCALVVGSELLSRLTDYEDRKTAILFGDGAGAVVVERTDDPSFTIGPFRLFSDGRRPELLFVERERDRIRMEGREVYRAAVAAMAGSVADLLAGEGLGPRDVDLLVAHQANQRILDAVAARLGVEPNVAFSNIVNLGNTSAASIPLALFDARARGLLNEGDLVVLTAFGAGFTWGAGLVRWGTRTSTLATAGAGARHA